MTIRYERVLVTPALARKWLRQNAANNRKPKTGKIPQYARDMQNGNWKLTGETIKFAPDGTLIDGQNRLHAVELAEVPVEFDVAYDVPREAMQVIDTGTSRTFADVLHMGGTPNRARVGTVVRWIIQWDAGDRIGSGATVRPTHSEMLARYEADPGGFDTAGARGADCNNHGLGMSSSSGVAFYLFQRIDKSAAHDFFDQVISGAGLTQGHPALVLRNRLIRARFGRTPAGGRNRLDVTGADRAEQLALFVRAWNFWRRDEAIERLATSRGELTNARFPVPK